MRTNLPVTQREYPFPDGTTLMSMTDTDSRVVYANAAFVTVSGFERGQLIGQPHNLVRHPDMPREAFADMWATLKAGQSWSALVKNRRADGDHYWVRANATPVMRRGQVAGYLSVRTRPAPGEVQQAESLYRRFREGRAKGLRFERGIVVRSGLGALLSLGKTMSLPWRIRLGCAIGALVPLAGVAVTVGTPMAIAIEAGLTLAGAALANALLQRQVARPIALVARQAQSVASGQPGENLNLERIDDIGMLVRSVNQAGLNLRSLVDDVARQVDALGEASGEIASGNLDLSTRTEQTAGRLQETASSMEQVAGNVRQSANNATTAHRLAGDAVEAASHGGEAARQMVETMGGISTSSRRIGEIIGVIDSIAFQTNILALNAAVEAARAGEEGRGFAVVASEVRALAQRSADAAREIKQLVAESVERVDAGNRQAAQTGESINSLVERVRRVGDLLRDISAAVTEQSQGVALVNGAVSELDRMTQQNAALVEEGAAAAAGLREQAAALAEAVAVFDTQTTVH